MPPRPPLPRSYDFTEHPPIIPPLPSDSSSLLCYSRGPVHLTEEKRMYQVQGYQRNGSYCVSGWDCHVGLEASSPSAQPPFVFTHLATFVLWIHFDFVLFGAASFALHIFPLICSVHI